jgi:hypothetical protein
VLLGYIALSAAQTPSLEIGWNPLAKALSILVFNGYSLQLSGASFIAFFILAYVLFRERYLKLTPPGKWIAVGYLFMFLVVPFQGVVAEVRVIIAAILILPAFLVFSPTHPAVKLLLPLGLSIIALLNAGYVASLWVAYQPEYARLKASFRLIERGGFVLVGRSSEESFLERPIYHAPVLAAHYANAFVPSLFIVPGQYSLQARPELKTWGGEPVPFKILEEILKGRGPFAAAYIRCWIVDYDYLYLIGPQGPNPMPSRLKALAAGEKFALYRIIRPPEEGNANANTPNPSQTLLGNAAGACHPR